MGTEWNQSCQDWLLVILTGKISRWYGSGMSLLTRYLSLLFCTTVDHFAPWHHCKCKTLLAPPFYSLCQCPWCPHFSHNPTEWWVQPFGFSSMSVLIWHLDHEEYTSKYLWSSKMIFCVLVDELAMKHKHITIFCNNTINETQILKFYTMCLSFCWAATSYLYRISRSWMSCEWLPLSFLQINMTLLVATHEPFPWGNWNTQTYSPKYIT
jgi:hypothetical protein